MSNEKNDFMAKLHQIEEHANLASAELAPGLMRSRLQHIGVLAKTLRGRLEPAGVAIVCIEPGGTSPGERDKPPA
jgi:hypothetical protein